MPAVLEAWEFMRDNVLRDGLVEPQLKRLCFRFLAGDEETMDFARFPERERLALRWAQAIDWDAAALHLSLLLDAHPGDAEALRLLHRLRASAVGARP